MKVTVSNDSPCLAYGATGAVDCGRLLLWHGGTSKYGGLPSGTLAVFDTQHQKWYTFDDGPRRSHHCAFVSGDKYFHIVGGWNGDRRTHDITTFDTRSGEWIRHPELKGFPEGGGLTSHTVNGLITEGDSIEAVVIGRLGGLRTQRCHSALLRLTGDIRRGFTYKGPIEREVTSRGGHSSIAISPNTITLLGGRADTFVGMQTEDIQLPIDIPQLQRPMWKRTSKEFETFECKETALSGRRYQATCLLSNQTILVHGGEPFGRMMIEAIFGNSSLSSEMWILDRKGKRLKVQRPEIPALCGHSMVPICRGEKLAIVGGLTSNGKPQQGIHIIH